MVELQKHLYSQVQASSETEALVTALLEEMEDAIGDAADASASANDTTEIKVSTAKNDKLKAVLKDLRGDYPV